MGDKTGIEWTDATWNPVTGCTKVSPGCDHCYAEKIAERFRGTPGHYFEQGFDVQLRPDKLDQPLRWTRPRRVFVNSMSDLFHDDVPEAFIESVFAIMAATPQHTYQILTKRPARMRSLLRLEFFEQAHRAAFEQLRRDRVLDVTYPGWPLPNVWLGVSTEDQKWADIRIPQLLATPAAVRFISAEPLLGEVEPWHSYCPLHDFPGGMCTFSCPERRRIEWVIAGGESGHGARPMHPDWARKLRDWCVEHGVPFHFKQWGEWTTDESIAGSALISRVGKKAAGRTLDGRTWDDSPQVAS